jgi:osmotically inducible lipoprotein OsmB
MSVFRVAAAPTPPECRPSVLRDEDERPPAGFERSPWEPSSRSRVSKTTVANTGRPEMRLLTATLCIAALLGLGACGRNATTRAATGGLGGAAVGTVLGGPVVGTAVGAAGGAAVGAATADD